MDSVRSVTRVHDPGETQSGSAVKLHRFVPNEEEIATLIPLGNQHLVRKCLASASYLAAAAMLVSLSVLVGYVFGIRRLLYLVNGGPLTHPLTAVGVFAAGLGILLSRSRRVVRPTGSRTR